MLLQCSNGEVPRKTIRLLQIPYQIIPNTGHFLFKLSTIVHYPGCFVNESYLSYALSIREGPDIKC
jgi:hypothetical protein